MRSIGFRFDTSDDVVQECKLRRGPIHLISAPNMPAWAVPLTAPQVRILEC